MSNDPARLFIRAIRALKDSGMEVHSPINKQTGDVNELSDLSERIEAVTRIIGNPKRNALSMIFFVMYDIENDNVRRNVARFLIRKGCERIQKSVFLAEGDRKLYNDISQTLLEVQQAYENQDSLFVVPVSTDQIKAMKIIGQGFNRDVYFNPPNTLFF